MSFGTELQLERERRQVSLHFMAERTRVPERFLSALEQEQFEDLPGGVFNNGILRSYCSDLGLDEDEWLARFEAAWPAPPAAELAESGEKAQRNRTPLGSGAGIRWWGVLLMLLVLGALAWAAWKYVAQPRVLTPPSTGTQALRSLPALESMPEWEGAKARNLWRPGSLKNA